MPSRMSTQSTPARSLATTRLLTCSRPRSLRPARPVRLARPLHLRSSASTPRRKHGRGSGIVGPPTLPPCSRRSLIEASRCHRRRAGQTRSSLFPSGIALGTDACHPRILLRLGPSLLPAFLKIFALCEIIGAWPTAIIDVFIALLPKTSGGLRPIGIFPTLVRIWFRLRAPYVRAWEHSHSRPFLFAGTAKGVGVALWLQAAHMENAGLSRGASAASLV